MASSPDLEELPRAARPVQLGPLRLLAEILGAGRNREGTKQTDPEKTSEDESILPVPTLPHSHMLLFPDTVQFAFDVAGENIGEFQISDKSKNATANVFNKVRGPEAVRDNPRKIREHCVNDGFSRQERIRDHSCVGPAKWRVR